MIPLITQHTDDIAEICRRHHVKRLEVSNLGSFVQFTEATHPNLHSDVRPVH